MNAAAMFAFLGRRRSALLLPLLLLLLLFVTLTATSHSQSRPPDYGEALAKSLLYFEAQRSGHLPHNQRVAWRDHSGLTDGLEQGVDLVGGYYNAGDNVKFGLPMAFTVTMLSWGVIEYDRQIVAAGELAHALEAIKWGTDYFIKARTHPNVLWAQPIRRVPGRRRAPQQLGSESCCARDGEGKGGLGRWMDGWMDGIGEERARRGPELQSPLCGSSLLPLLHLGEGDGDGIYVDFYG